jgi:hypothetical protein
MFGNANRINTELETYRSIKPEEIREVARKYLNPNQRLYLQYVPESPKPAPVVEEPAPVIEEPKVETPNAMDPKKKPKKVKKPKKSKKK